MNLQEFSNKLIDYTVTRLFFSTFLFHTVKEKYKRLKENIHAENSSSNSILEKETLTY